MSRSKRKPYYKDKGHKHANYHKTIRSVTKHFINLKYNIYAFEGIEHLDDFENERFNIPTPRVIINDYDYSDYTWVYYEKEDGEWFVKMSRK